MAILDNSNDSNEFHDKHFFEEDYKSALSSLSLEKKFMLHTIESTLTRMSKEQLISYSKAITAQKFQVEDICKEALKRELGF